MKRTTPSLRFRILLSVALGAVLLFSAPRASAQPQHDEHHEGETAEEHGVHDDDDEHDEHHEGETAEEHAAHGDEDEDHEHDEHHEGETAEEHAAHGDEHGHDHDHAHEHGGHEVTLSAILADTHFQTSCIAFLLLLMLLRFGYGKAGKPALVARRREIEENLAEAQAKKAEAEALRAEYKSRLERMEEELARIRVEMIKAGEAERDRIVQDAEAKAATMRKDAEFQISQKLKQLRVDLKKEAVMAAVAAAEVVVKAQASAADQSRLADDYLNQLVGAAHTEENRP